MDDGHISRVIKNWAALQQPPKYLKRRILTLAAAEEFNPDEKASIFQWLEFLSPRLIHLTPNLFHQVPFSQSRYWSFQFATSWRVAN